MTVACAVADDCINFPMPELLTGIYILWSAFDGDSFRGTFGFPDFIIASLPLGLFPQVLIGHFGDESLVYVAVQRWG